MTSIWLRGLIRYAEELLRGLVGAGCASLNCSAALGLLG
jgi:hypothetical protein